MQDESHQVFLALGSNLGDRRAILAEAVRLIGERVGEVTHRSTLIETNPWGFQSEHRFLNGVIRCETTLTPRQLLATTQAIERALGKRPIHATDRTPQTSDIRHQTYKDRPVDIDILLYDDLLVDEPGLKIPHPLMQQRDFVMIPLREIMNQMNK